MNINIVYLLYPDLIAGISCIKHTKKSVLNGFLINTCIFQNVLLFRVHTGEHLSHNRMQLHFHYL